MRTMNWSRGAAWGVVLLWTGIWTVSAEESAVPAAPALPGAPAALVPAAPPVPAAPAVLPVVVHSGKLLRVERVTGALPWVDTERVLAAGNLDAGTGGAEAVVSREPGAGQCFAVAVLEVTGERSLSKYDYRLDAGGKAYACLGLGAGGNPFDARRWKVATPGEVGMLFQIPAEQTVVHLVPALTSSVPLRAVRGIAFAPAAAPAPPAAAPVPAVPDAVPAAGPAVPAVPAAVPAAVPPPAAAPAKPAPAKRDALEF